MVSDFKTRSLFLVYLFGFLSAFSTASVAYIDSSFLSTFIQQKFVGNIYIIAYIFVIICFLITPFILRRFGNFKVALFLVITELVALLGVALLVTPIWIIICLMVNLITIPLIYFSADIFLEGYSSNKQTGVIRGIYLTAINLAWVLAQLINGPIVISNGYQRIYFVSFLLVASTALILILGFRKFKDSSYPVVNIWQTTKSVWKNKNLLNIIMANFLLYFFYSWMIIYIPIYLNGTIGFSWKEIGVIFSIMLLPFVLVQFPSGYLADKKYGEKEMLNVGFVIVAVATGSIFFITGGNLILWATILFATRIGAAIIEVMCNAYFFKKVDGLDANIISFFRLSGTLAYVFGALFATLFLNFLSFDIRHLFLVLGLVMLIGLKFGLSLKDTN